MHVQIVLVLFGYLALAASQDLGNENPCPSTTVDCSCMKADGQTVIVQINITTKSVVDEDTGMDRCIVDRDPLSLCEEHHCVIIPNENFAALFQQGKRISPSNYLMEEEEDFSGEIFYQNSTKTREVVDQLIQDAMQSPFYPIEFTYPRMIHGENSQQRLKRDIMAHEGDDFMESDFDPQPESGDIVHRQWGGGTYASYACHLPQLRNSEVTCWKWPNWQTCKQTCIYGHGVPTSRGTVRSNTYTCRNSENTWNPNKIVDCQPYLNCRIRLKSPGDLKCVEPTNKAPWCDVSCEDYDDYKAQSVRVTCDEKEGSMQLPHCATLDQNVAKIAPPSGY